MHARQWKFLEHASLIDRSPSPVIRTQLYTWELDSEHAQLLEKSQDDHNTSGGLFLCHNTYMLSFHARYEWLIVKKKEFSFVWDRY